MRTHAQIHVFNLFASLRSIFFRILYILEPRPETISSIWKIKISHRVGSYLCPICNRVFLTYIAFVRMSDDVLSNLRTVIKFFIFSENLREQAPNRTCYLQVD